MRLSAEDLMHHPWFADMKTRMKIRPYKPRVTPSSLSPRLCQREESDSSDEMEVTVKRAEVPKAVEVEVVPSPRVEPEEVKEEKPVEKPEEVKEEKPVEKPEEVKEKPVEKPEEKEEKPEEKEEKPEEVKEKKEEVKEEKKEQNDQK